MRLFGARDFEVMLDPPGRLIYREGNVELTFPVFESDGEWILVDDPSFKRIRLFFGWYVIPVKFTDADRSRISPRLVEYLRSDRMPVRVFDRDDSIPGAFSFYPELFDQRAIASELLADAGIEWMASYSTIDLLHEEHGLEVCGIQQEADLQRIAATLREAFPHWHYSRICHKERGRDPGWKFIIHMFPRKCGGGRSIDAGD